MQSQYAGSALSDYQGQALVEPLSLCGDTRYYKFLCEANQKRSSGLTKHTSGFDMTG